jgi:hypothetical protein
VEQSQEMICGGRYLSGDEAVRVFAAGTADNRMRIEVTWRNGRQSVVAEALANHIYEIGEAAATNPGDPESPPEQPYFVDASERLGHEHGGVRHEDFERQPMLPKRLSELGPGVSWYDLNGDGWEDMLIGSGTGGGLAVFLNNGQAGFRRITSRPATEPAERTQTTVLGWRPGEQSSGLLVGVSGYEEGRSGGLGVRVYDLTRGEELKGWVMNEGSAGPLALGDMDGDGWLDLFVGGRVKPGRYPEGGGSRVFRGGKGGFEADEANTAVVGEAGMVSGAVWSDLDGDGWPELILACEWGPVRVYKNTDGALQEVTDRVGLAGYVGLWNGVATGDLDGDGRLDRIPANVRGDNRNRTHGV